MLCKKPWFVGSFSPVPCGQCTPCLVNRRRMWATRVVLEARVSSASCFLTLTYDDEHLPSDLSLKPHHHKNFMKRFRKELPPSSLRYLAVGEYGGQLYEGSGERYVNPHYHYALFGYDCLGAIRYPGFGRRCFCRNCELVRSVWHSDAAGTGGNIVIEPLNMATASYISGYVLKKMTKQHDDRLEGRFPEFKRSSNGGGKSAVKGGIGAPAVFNLWNAMHSEETGEIFEVDGDVISSIMMEGKRLPLGRYLRRKLRGLYREKEGAPQEVLYEAQWALRDLYEADGGDKKYLTTKRWLLEKHAGSVQLLEARLTHFKKGKSL